MWPLVLILGLLVSCARHPGRPETNGAPFVRIVRGAIVAGDTLNTIPTLNWIGWDLDGAIDHYEFAIDIPDSFDIAAINDPATRGIAWRDTTVTEARFLLKSSRAESLLKTDGTIEVTNRAVGDHTFYVRSVDDAGAMSPVDFIHFTVSNVLPTTTITAPDFAKSQFAAVGTEVYISWVGRDPDKPTADLRPIAYEYKLIPIASVFASSDPQYAVDVAPGPQYPWIRLAGSQTSLHLKIEEQRAYWFVIRAIDVAGGKERAFITGVNAFKMDVSLQYYDKPKLTVREPYLGKRTFPDEGLVIEAQIYIDRCLQFDYSADMSSYGGVLQGFNIGVDVADVDDYSAESGFQGWTLISHPLKPICFSTPGLHTVVILCRDTGGGTTVGQYLIRVLPIPPRDREVLYVDDFCSRGVGSNIDRGMDSRTLAMLQAAGYAESEIYRAEPWGTDDRNGIVTVLTRPDLWRYHLVVWLIAAGGSTGSGATALLNASVCGADNWLRAYLRDGGAVWIYGQQVFSATKSTSNWSGACRPDFTSNRNVGLTVGPSDFLCLFMGFCGGDVRNIRVENSKIDGLHGALPTASAAADLFPALEVDSTQYAYTLLGGLYGVDIQYEPVYAAGGGLDTLYTIVPASTKSRLSGKPVAWRYADPDPAPRQGPLAVFGFTLHDLKPGSAESRTGVHGMARSLVAWFQRHTVP